MADENEAPAGQTTQANVDPLRLRVVLGPNPVVKPKKTYIDWTYDLKYHFVKCVKHRNAHMPKRKGDIPISQKWDLVLEDLKSDNQKRYTGLDSTDGKTLQSTYNRFREEVMKANGVTKDAINVSGLNRVDNYSALVLQMEEQRFNMCKESHDKSEAKVRKRKILGAMAATVLNAQGAVQHTPDAEPALVDATPISGLRSSPETSGGTASVFIRNLTERITERLGVPDQSELKDAQLRAAVSQARAAEAQEKLANAQLKILERQARPRYERPSGTSSTSSSSFLYGSSPEN